MTQYLSILTLDALSALTLEELAALGINEPVLTSGHAPFIIRDAQDFNSRYIIEDSDDWSS